MLYFSAEGILYDLMIFNQLMLIKIWSIIAALIINYGVRK